MDNGNKNILIIGGGLSGIHSCKKVAEQGFPVTLIDQGEGFSLDPCYTREGSTYFRESLENLEKTPSITIFNDTKLTRLEGEIGSFKVSLIKDKEIIQREFGLIVIALPYSYEPVFSQYQLSPSDNILSLGNAEKTLLQRGKEPGVVVFLMDFERDSNPLSFKRTISVARDIAKRGGRSFIITRYVKVACPGMEKLVSEAKKEGAFIIKSSEPPVVKTNGTIEIYARDSILEKEIKIEADKVVVEDRLSPSGEASFLADILGLHTDPRGFLQSNNVRRVPVFTNIKGILVSGTAVGIKPFYQIMADGLNVAMEALKISQGKGEYGNKIEIDVDTEKCARCLTCYRVCPHGAISWNGERIVISSLMCEGCGTCASECPMNAIELKDYADGKIKEKLDKIFERESSPIIGFCCKNSALEAWEEIISSRQEMEKLLYPVEVPCAGKVDIDYIMEALVRGAQGVILAACHPGNCKSEKGTTFASYRVYAIKKLLEEVGLDPTRIAFVPVASNEASSFIHRLQAFKEAI